MPTTMALREFQYWWTHYIRNWRGSVVISVANPLLFLVAIGAGLDKLVSSGTGALHGVSYLAFFAPGMLAAASMQNGIIEGSFPVSRAKTVGGSYQVAAATPLEPVDILAGHALFMTVRVTMSAVAFFVVMAAFGTVTWPWGLLALPAAVLTGLAFAAPAAAWAVTVRDPGRIGELFKWVVMPLYLFSGTFFAVEQMPPALRPIAYASPLWHGADLCRSLTLGTATLTRSTLHIGYLVACVLIGLWNARRTYPKNLHS
jgi:ABC-type polysaccharide/polyol phosphate export permease